MPRKNIIKQKQIASQRQVVNVTIGDKKPQRRPRAKKSTQPPSQPPLNTGPFISTQLSPGVAFGGGSINRQENGLVSIPGINAAQGSVGRRLGDYTPPIFNEIPIKAEGPIPSDAKEVFMDPEQPARIQRQIEKQRAMLNSFEQVGGGAKNDLYKMRVREEQDRLNREIQERKALKKSGPVDQEALDRIRMRIDNIPEPESPVSSVGGFEPLAPAPGFDQAVSRALFPSPGLRNSPYESAESKFE
jgi:hypothetical protein